MATFVGSGSGGMKEQPGSHVEIVRTTVASSRSSAQPVISLSDLLCDPLGYGDFKVLTHAVLDLSDWEDPPLRDDVTLHLPTPLVV